MEKSDGLNTQGTTPAPPIAAETLKSLLFAPSSTFIWALDIPNMAVTSHSYASAFSHYPCLYLIVNHVGKLVDLLAGHILKPA